MADQEDYDSLRRDVGATIEMLPDPAAEAIFVQAAKVFSDPASQLAHTRCIALRQLAAAAATMTNYTQNNTKEEQGRIFDNYMRLLTLWQDELDAAIGSASTSQGNVRFGKTKHKPARLEEYPDFWLWNDRFYGQTR